MEPFPSMISRFGTPALLTLHGCIAARARIDLVVACKRWARTAGVRGAAAAPAAAAAAQARRVGARCREVPLSAAGRECVRHASDVGG